MGCAPIARRKDNQQRFIQKNTRSSSNIPKTILTCSSANKKKQVKIKSLGTIMEVCSNLEFSYCE